MSPPRPSAPARMLRRLRRRLGGEPPEPAAPLVSGIVERIERRQLVGWVTVPVGTPDIPVTLHVGKVQVSQAYPSRDTSLTATPLSRQGDSAEPRRPERQGQGTAKPTPVAAPRPPGSRNSGGEVRGFSMQISGIWDYVRRGTRIRVRFQGQPLPIAGHGMFATPTQHGSHSPEDLRQRLAEGYVLTQFGEVVLSKRLDSEWQTRVMALYEGTRRLVKERFGYDVFVLYGTLLGVVREGGYINHDADFDAGYVSAHRNGPEAAAELVQVAEALMDAGYRVDLRQRLLHIHDPQDEAYRIDLFHLFFDESDELRFPWGVAGSGVLTRADVTGTHEAELPGGTVLVPDNEAAFVAHLYGDDWRLPNPGFTWSRSRTDAADDALLTLEQRSRVYWANYYRSHPHAEASSFFAQVAARPDLPGTVLDIGCGDGRDSLAFAERGLVVHGLDHAEVGIEQASARAAAAGLEDRATFRVCELADPATRDRVLAELTAAAEGPVLFYLRFFLHAVGQEVGDGLLETLGRHARTGDLVAAEFRTEKDKGRAKTSARPFRRFVRVDEVTDALAKLGFEVLDASEDSGLSAYGDEDPVLGRVVARR